MIIRILDEAEKDIVEGFRFYELQADGLGVYFLDSIFSDIDSLRLFSGIHMKTKGFHRLLSKRFPFAIYYTCSDKRVDVWVVLDCCRDPGVMRERLEP